MKIATWNINGLRSGEQKMLEFLKNEKPDMVCFQEIKVDEKSLPESLKSPNGYKSYWSHAQKPGYAGVAIYTLQEPQKIEYGMGIEEFDREGRTIVLHFNDLILANFYFPHSGRDLSRLDFKMRFNEAFLEFVKKFDPEKLVICGDLNVAHEEIDIARPKDNRKNAGFTDQEREFADKIIDNGFIDVYRHLYPQKQEFSWWSQRFGARARNVGWRIDYFLIKNLFLNKVKDCRIETQVFGSDHCPVILEFK